MKFREPWLVMSKVLEVTTVEKSRTIRIVADVGKQTRLHKDISVYWMKSALRTADRGQVRQLKSQVLVDRQFQERLSE